MSCGVRVSLQGESTRIMGAESDWWWHAERGFPPCRNCLCVPPSQVRLIPRHRRRSLLKQLVHLPVAVPWGNTSQCISCWALPWAATQHTSSWHASKEDSQTVSHSCIYYRYMKCMYYLIQYFIQAQILSRFWWLFIVWSLCKNVKNLVNFS